ncbi:methyltransferase [Novosphingobium sp. HBC54]|uniref:Methyltransferase n=2 Tax=Novosphingobium cyanobacteriorum TaxID=3024215 RepID=A0ABT6CQE1_9SPHN|nr:methyltransferase [Novosphingobium cyanobacteriorum]
MSTLPNRLVVSAPPQGWRLRWVAWRNSVIASPSFQHWAARLPIFRSIAQRRAGQSFDLVAGFCYSQVLTACVQLGLLDLLAQRAHDLASLAGATGLSEDAALRLIRAACALSLAEQVASGLWMLGQQGAALQANPGAIAMVRHHALLYSDLADPAALLRRDRAEPTALSSFWRYAASTPGPEAARYSALMAASQAMVAQQVLAAYRFDRHARLLDVGGGHGAFAIGVAKACPELGIGVFDLPPVVAGTAGVLAEAGLSEKVRLHPGDFFCDSLPVGYDCITLVRILHDHDDDAALALLRSVHAALPPGGRLVIAEPMADAPGAAAMGDAYFGLYLWAMNSGRPRSFGEYGALLKSAGFSASRSQRTAYPVVSSLIVSSK